VPFINIDANQAQMILEDRSLLLELLKKEIINPKEYDLLIAAIKLKEGDEGANEQIRAICTENFGEEAERAIEQLTKYATSERKQVSWVLFSRTNQFIRYEQKKPFENYYPKETTVLIVDTFETLVPEVKIDNYNEQ